MAKSTKKSRASAIVRIILFTLVALILGITVYGWNAKNLTGNRMPMPFGYGASIVLSGSMEPRLSVDDLVIVKKTDSIKKDDIIVYQDGNSLVIHRVFEIDGDTVTTWGDANNTPDEPISLDAVKGVLVCDIPYVGLAVEFVRQPVVIVLMLAAAIFLAERSFRKEKDKSTGELDEIKSEIEALIKDIKSEQSK